MILKIFFSWQVETNLQGFNNKAFLIECIESAIKQIENRGALKGIRLKLTEGLRNIPGNPEVSQLMFDQIDNCDIFICLLYTSPSPRDISRSRMPSSA